MQCPYVRDRMSTIGDLIESLGHSTQLKPTHRLARSQKLEPSDRSHTSWHQSGYIVPVMCSGGIATVVHLCPLFTRRFHFPCTSTRLRLSSDTRPADPGPRVVEERQASQCPHEYVYIRHLSLASYSKTGEGRLLSAQEILFPVFKALWGQT